MEIEASMKDIFKKLGIAKAKELKNLQKEDFGNLEISDIKTLSEDKEYNRYLFDSLAISTIIERFHYQSKSSLLSSVSKASALFGFAEGIKNYLINKWLYFENKDERGIFLDSIICIINIRFYSNIIGRDYNKTDDYEDEIKLQQLIRNLKKLNDDAKKSKLNKEAFKWLKDKRHIDSKNMPDRVSELSEFNVSLKKDAFTTGWYTQINDFLNKYLSNVCPSEQKINDFKDEFKKLFDSFYSKNQYVLNRKYTRI